MMVPDVVVAVLNAPPPALRIAPGLGEAGCGGDGDKGEAAALVHVALARNVGVLVWGRGWVRGQAGESALVRPHER